MIVVPEIGRQSFVDGLIVAQVVNFPEVTP
jgi:hypothetical protein